MLTIDWSKLCNGVKVTDMLSLTASSKLPAYEDYLCKLNWTVIYTEMMEQDPDIREYNRLVNNFDTIYRKTLLKLPLNNFFTWISATLL